MKMKFILIAIIVLGFIAIPKIFGGTSTQADTIKAIDVLNNVATIDGIGDDNCWGTAKWQYIDQVWINYGETIDPSDFSGKYKVVWSSVTNLLYFLVEVTDDVFVDGWPNVAGDYYAFDIVELFIDQDNSGGLHVFDGTGSVGESWGTNAENAFSYHINIDLPLTGEVSTECVVNDIAGTKWGDLWNPDFANHFPEIALREIEGKYYWEFSLLVFDESYDHNNPNVSIVEMKVGDIMGLSMAYCDNDDLNEDPKERDNFIGSVWVPADQYNDHWMNADGFGTIELVSNVTSVSSNKKVVDSFQLINNFPNPFNPNTNIDYHISKTEFVTLKIYDILGREIKTLVNKNQNMGSYRIAWDGKNSNGNQVTSGVYFYRLQAGEYVATKKMTYLR